MVTFVQLSVRLSIDAIISKQCICLNYFYLKRTMKPTSLIPAFILAVAGLPAANDDPTLKNTLVGNVAFSGSGCPNGTAVTTIQNNAATIAFSKLKTELAKDLKTTTVSLDCGAIFHVNVPTGWKFRPYKGDTRLYVQVDKGIYGIVRTAYSVAKSSNAVSLGH